MIIRIAASIICGWVGVIQADASKQFLYSIDHSKLDGFTTNPPPGYTQSISVGPLSNMGAQAIVSQTPSSNATALPNPQYLTIFDKKGSKLWAEQLPIQVTKGDCNLPRFDANVPGYYLFDVCPSLFYSIGSIQNQRTHDFVKIWSRKYHNLDNKYSAANYYYIVYAYILDINKGGDKRWTLLDQKEDKDYLYPLTLWQNPTPTYPLVYVVHDQPSLKSDVYKLSFR